MRDSASFPNLGRPSRVKFTEEKNVEIRDPEITTEVGQAISPIELAPQSPAGI
jgi:hypothetical protein